MPDALELPLTLPAELGSAAEVFYMTPDLWGVADLAGRTLTSTRSASSPTRR